MNQPPASVPIFRSEGSRHSCPVKTSVGVIESGSAFSRREHLVGFAERATRLYEQERKRPNGPSRLGCYVKRWVAWASGGLAEVAPGCPSLLGDRLGDRLMLDASGASPGP